MKNLLLSLHSRCHVAHCVSLFGFLNCCRTEYREWGCLLPCRTLCFFLCCREGMLKRPLSFVLFSVTHTPCWLFVMMQCLSLCCKWIGYFFFIYFSISIHAKSFLIILYSSETLFSSGLTCIISLCLLMLYNSIVIFTRPFKYKQHLSSVIELIYSI